MARLWLLSWLIRRALSVGARAIAVDCDSRWCWRLFVLVFSRRALHSTVIDCARVEAGSRGKVGRPLMECSKNNTCRVCYIDKMYCCNLMKEAGMLR